MNETDKVIIALGFFTLVGFIAYLYFLRVAPPTSTVAEMSLNDLKKAKENWIVRR